MLWGFVERSTGDDGGLDRSATARAFIGGVLFALVVVVVLATVDKLRGPGLYGSLPVVPELVIHGLLGATVGARPWTLLQGRRADRRANLD